MSTKKQYIVNTYVEASSAKEALEKATKTKPHEAYIHNSWWEKREYEWGDKDKDSIGFKPKK